MDAVDESGLSAAARAKYGNVSVVDTTAGIPDEAHVAAAKAKRRAALEQAAHGGEEEFISLTDGRGRLSLYDGDKGPHPESRLQREEDEEGEGDEGKIEALLGGFILKHGVFS
jgi:GC-rich sequence DNA-binding factor